MTEQFAGLFSAARRLSASLGPVEVAKWLLMRRSGRLVTSVGVGYLLGSFSTADAVSKWMGGGVDLRATGSKNPGAANAIKVLGTKAGLAVMAGDITKGAVACGVGAALAGSTAAHLAGTASVAGHCHPVWNGFHGGKGVATSVGQCLATFPAYFPIDVGVAAATAAVPAFKHRAFAATLVSSGVWVVGGVVWWAKGWRNLWGPKPTVMLPVGALLSSLMIAQRFIAAGDPSARAFVDTPVVAT
jgi:glycerol-3-phosphate acyltransferase PlsY